ncbi:MAG: PaaI family thioesterase [Planctomycetota bacterium]
MNKVAIRKRWKSMKVYDFLGIRVDSAGGGKARLKLPWREELTQPLGYVHGGIIATLADAAAGWALFPEVERAEGCTTLQMQVNFLAPVVKSGMVATAKIVRLGRTTALMDVEVKAGRTLCAKALVTYHIKR